MMEVTPQLKTVLKNYQHSATKSLQGPGLSLVPPPKHEQLSPTDLKSEAEDFIPSSPFPVQQLPILTSPDTSCTERTETILEGETISCFVVGGEKRLCLPQVLISVLRQFTLSQINQECDNLQIYCSRCTPEQLNVLKNNGILPSGAPSSGLITKTDAVRLCSALLHGQSPAPVRPRKGALSFAVHHKCFGKCRGVCYPELYTAKTAKCIECSSCQGGFSPEQFVCHVHRQFSENRTVHWGFDAVNWREYLRVCKDQNDKEQYTKYLDEMKQQCDGTLPFVPPHNVYTSMKRKVLASDIIKEQQQQQQDLVVPQHHPKKQKLLGAYAPAAPVPYLYASLDAMYLNQCMDFSNRHLSAFKPVNQQLKDAKMFNQLLALGNYNHRYQRDAPVLQHPDKVVFMSESERFERTFQPNVALAPPIPKKHRYIVKTEPVVKVEDPTLKVVVKQEQEKYSSEIELSTDTEDSASETCDNNKLSPSGEPGIDLPKLEELLKTLEHKQVVLDFVQRLMAENERLLADNQAKEQRIQELENSDSTTNNNNDCMNHNKELLVCNGDLNNCSSIKTETSSDKGEGAEEEVDRPETAISVIACLEQPVNKQAIISTAPE